MSNQTTIRPLSTLASLATFKGERIDKVQTMSTEEAIRLGVNLMETGEETKGRGVFVIANAAKECKTAEEAKAFMAGLKAEMVNSAKERALELLPPNAKDAQKVLAVDNATAEATKRYDNLGQAIRAAKWVLANPAKVADGLSVFTVAQVNAYLEAPKDDDKAKEEKAKVRKAVLPLLAKPGTSQGAIKAAVSAAKEEIAKAKEVPDNRTEEQKAADAKTARIRAFVHKAATILADWDSLAADGVEIASIRAELVNPADKAKGTLAEVLANIGKLSGKQ